jgi:uncharacterized phage-associated protein
MPETLNSIEQTEQCEEAVLDWRKAPEDDQLYATFKVHFKAADVEYKQKVTANSGGYRGANMATTSDLEASLRANIHAKYAASAAAAAALSATQAPWDQTSQRTRTKACPITTNELLLDSRIELPFHPQQQFMPPQTQGPQSHCHRG